MKIIVGLGNIGDRYTNTRHNVGFLSIDYLKDVLKITNTSQKHKAEIAFGEINNQKIALAKPHTFMNLSGESVSEIVNYYKADPAQDLIIIQDELDLPFSEVRVSKNSRSGGHNGIQSIIEKLGTQNFTRIRVGIESRQDKKIPPTEKYVLMPFSEDEKKQLNEKILKKIADNIKELVI